MNKKIKCGKEYDLKIDKRYFQFNRDTAIKDVFDALVELITNSDDSYHHLFKRKSRNIDGGKILIEVCRRRGDKPSSIIVRDRAEGLTLTDMFEKLGQIGKRKSETGDRGFLARGAKDCTALGDLTYESIVDEKYYKCQITYQGKFIALTNEKGRIVNNELRKDLHIEKGNGTVVSLHILNHKIPQIDTISKNLPLHFALRDIISEESPAEILIRSCNEKEKPKRIIYRYPECKLVVDEKFIVPGYQDAEVTLKIWKTNEQLDDVSDKFRKSGFLIKGGRAIHECSFLHHSFEKDEYAKYFIGRLECPYIDILLEEYDNRREKGIDQSIHNPSIVIDPNRQYGLLRNHPFTEKLFEIPTQKLKFLIDELRSSEEKNRDTIANKETDGKLNELAKAASKFIREQIEDLEILTTDDDSDQQYFAEKGIMIFPTYANIIVNTHRNFSLYVNKKIYNRTDVKVNISSDSDAIEIIDKDLQLAQHPKKSDLLFARFKVLGRRIDEGICIETKSDYLPKAEALFSVIEDKIEQHEFSNPIEFEFNNYRIKEGSTRTLKLYAKYPEIVNHAIEVKVVSEDNQNLPIMGKCKLVPIEGSNFALSEVRVEARRLINKTINVYATLNGFKANTKVKFVKQDKSGIDIKIEITYKVFGNYRAAWGDLDNKPNLLEISAKHPSIKRYLGSPPDYEGQNSIIFKTILAEIVSESVCRKTLSLEAENQSWKFNWAEKREDPAILENVLYEYARRMKSFLPVAHSIMIKDSDISKY